MYAFWLIFSISDDGEGAVYEPYQYDWLDCDDGDDDDDFDYGGHDDDFDKKSFTLFYIFKWQHTGE